MLKSTEPGREAVPLLLLCVLWVIMNFSPVMAVCELRVFFMQCQDRWPQRLYRVVKRALSSLSAWHFMTSDIYKMCIVSLCVPHPTVLGTHGDYFQKHKVT